MIDDRFIRIGEVCEKTSLSKSNIYAMVKRGEFPEQVRLSYKVAAWRESQVAAWMEKAMPASGSQDEGLLV